MTQKKIQTIDGATLMNMPLEELRFVVAYLTLAPFL
jgi:hypothetical protein